MAKASKDIYNLDTLDEEIARLKLESKNVKSKFEDNLKHLQKDYLSLFIQSLFNRKCKKETTENDSTFNCTKEDKVNRFFSRIGNNILDRIAKKFEKYTNENTQNQR